MVKPAFDYYSGKYGLCKRCKARPCLCSEAPTAPAPRLEVLPSPATAGPQAATGNAIPFAIWDTIIPNFMLSPVEGAVLAYLARKTIGYGKHAGDVFSERQIAAALNTTPATARRALHRLADHGAIEIRGLYYKDTRARAKTFIRVTIGEG